MAIPNEASLERGRIVPRASICAQVVGLFLLGLAISGVTGCGGEAIEPIKVSVSNDPLEKPRTLLKRYANGAPIGSEATSFEYMINEVKKVDAVRGEKLEKGFAALQKAEPSQIPGIATELLSSIQPAGIPAP